MSEKICKMAKSLEKFFLKFNKIINSTNITYCTYLSTEKQTI